MVFFLLLLFARNGNGGGQETHWGGPPGELKKAGVDKGKEERRVLTGCRPSSQTFTMAHAACE